MVATSAPTPHPKDLVKPTLRGVIHQWSALVSLVAVIVLLALPQAAHVRIGSAIYGVTIVGLFSVSATYHRVTWATAKARALMKRADHSMIFVFIAGTYTPLCLAALHGRLETIMLIVVWVGALGGVVTSTIYPHAPRWVTVPLYIALGWVAVFAMPDILHSAGVATVVLLILGGVLYSVGAVCYATRRPNPWPGTFGYHEVFHIFTAVAALCHYISVSLAVVN
jgi:hemolysin III